MSDIFENKGALTATIVVAAADSLNQGQANYVCDGTNDEVEIQAALDALPDTGGEVKLLDGTYYIESSLVLDSYQTLRGCGRNTILTTTTADLDIITATGGDSTEKVGILIADLCVDGNAGGVANDMAIIWTYVDYSKISNCWLLNNGQYGIELITSDSNIISGNTCQGNTQIGIDLYNSDDNIISGNTCQGNGWDGIYVDTSFNNTISDNIFQGNTDQGIYLESSDNTAVSGNICQGNGKDGIFTTDSEHNTISVNTCQGNGNNGIKLDTSSNNTISVNTCQGNDWDGILIIESSLNNVISGNTCQGNDYHGIRIDIDSHRNTIVGNSLTENSQDASNTYDDIFVGMSNYNNIQANTCRAGVLANKPRYGINLCDDATAPDGTLVANNDLYDDGFGTAPFNDDGTGTKLATYKVPFSDGSDPQDSGFLIDDNTEYARAWLRLPNKVVQVVRMKVYARSVVAEADKMRAEFVVYGGADNQPYTTHNGSVANHPSTSEDFAADDVIYWTLITAGVLALLGGDSVEVKVLHEAADNGDCTTNAYLRTVEIEYV